MVSNCFLWWCLRARIMDPPWCVVYWICVASALFADVCTAYDASAWRIESERCEEFESSSSMWNLWVLYKDLMPLRGCFFRFGVRIERADCAASSAVQGRFLMCLSFSWECRCKHHGQNQITMLQVFSLYRNSLCAVSGGRIRPKEVPRQRRHLGRFLSQSAHW